MGQESNESLEQKLNELRIEITQMRESQSNVYIGWFIRRIEALEQENQSLKAEQACGDHEANPTIELKQLRQENERLKQQLSTAQAKLNSVRLLLKRTSEPKIAPAPEIPTSSEVPSVDPSPVSNVAFKPRGPKTGKALQRAENIFSAIKEWNHQNPSETFAINPGLIETVFRVHRQAVKTFFETYQNELWEYHQEIGVESPRWHNRGKDTERLKTFVTKTLQP